MHPEQLPAVIVIGGPNGAGKSTCAAEFLPHEFDVRQFVNADVIASGLSAFAPETVALHAGRIMLARLDELAAQRQDFAFETTLSARTHARFLRRLQAEGYRVEVYYVRLESPDLAVLRVAARVRRGGHAIPEETIRRRYWRGLVNLMELYRPPADSWVLCDNSGEELRIIARGKAGEPSEIEDERVYSEIEQAVAARRDTGVED